MSSIGRSFTLMSFQSTPPSEESGDLPPGGSRAGEGVSIHAALRRERRRLRSWTIPCTYQFQSTPPSEESGDLEVGALVRRRLDVSIHAALRRERRLQPRNPPVWRRIREESRDPILESQASRLPDAQFSLQFLVPASRANPRRFLDRSGSATARSTAYAMRGPLRSRGRRTPWCSAFARTSESRT